MTQHTHPSSNSLFNSTPCGTRCGDPKGTRSPHARSRPVYRVLHVALLISFLLVTLPTVAGAALVTTTETAPTSTNYYLGLGTTYLQQAQSVKATGTEISQISVALIVGEGTPPMDITLYVKSGSVSGTTLGSTTISHGLVTSTNYASPDWVTVPISVTGLSVGTTYYIVLKTATYDSHNYYKTPANTGNPYADGIQYRNTAGTSTTANDLLVKVWFNDMNPPVADFTATPTSGSAPLSVQFTDTSTNSPTAWTWGFGDGTNSTTQNPSHTYAPGTYTVTLTATNGVGSDAETKGAHITVVKGTPVITWVNPADITYGTALSGTQLNANANVAGTFVYTPAAGTVLSAGSQTLHVAFTPTDTTNYNSASKDVTITVNKATPVITWANPAAIPYGTALSGTQLNANANVAGSYVYTPAAGTVLSAGSQTLHVAFTPTDTANYNSASKDVTLTVTPPPPGAAFSAIPTSGVAPQSVAFTDESTNTPTSWSWNFGDGQTSTAQNPGHSYATPGTYTVTLTATNAAGGNTLTRTNYVTVTAPAPVAAFTATPTSGAAPLSVTFTDQSANFPASWSWNFGDGQTSTAQNPSHTYDTPGTYTVTLTATNPAGSDPETKTGYITVTIPMPVAGFSGTPTTGPLPLMVVFTDQSTNSPTSWSWNFGDGSTSTLQNPSHNYITQGLFTVTLTATNDGGIDSEIKIGYVTVGNPSQSLVFLTSTDTDRKTARKGDLVNVSIRLVAGEASPVDGMILLDRSGDSMRTCMKSVNGVCQYYRWDLAKEGALALTGSMSSKSNLGVAWFATRGDIAHTLDNSQTQVSNEIQAMDYVPYGYTTDPYTGPGTGGIAGMSNLRDGLYKTIKYLGERPHENLRTRAVIIFTDGYFNWYGSPLAHGRGYALRSKVANVICYSGICENGAETNNRPYNPANVNSFWEDRMWWPGASEQYEQFPSHDYTFYNWIRDNRPNGGWLNFTGLKWNGMASLGDGAHIHIPSYTGDGKTYTSGWPGSGGYTQCVESPYMHCDSETESQRQLDVCAPEWPYIDGSGVPHGNCEQTEQNMTIFARDSNIRLYTVVIRTDADTGTTMPSSVVTADDMMKTLAYTTGGKYYAVRNQADLDVAIADISADLASAATKDLTMELEDTSVDVNSLLTVNTNNEVFAHVHRPVISTTVHSWDMNGNTKMALTTIAEPQDWLSTHGLHYFVDDLNVGDAFEMNFTVQVNARGRINAIGPDSRVTFKDGFELALPPTYIDVENAPPVFDEVGQQTVDLLETLTFTISATDGDNPPDPLTYASVSLPQGATFDINTLTFEWTPENKGSYVATFSVTDGLASDTLTVPITVTDLRPKIIIR